jgi:hypothetical protein
MIERRPLSVLHLMIGQRQLLALQLMPRLVALVTAVRRWTLLLMMHLRC